MRGLTLFADAAGVELTTGRASFVKVRPNPSAETNGGSAGTVNSADTAAGENTLGTTVGSPMKRFFRSVG